MEIRRRVGWLVTPGFMAQFQERWDRKDHIFDMSDLSEEEGDGMIAP